MAGPEGSLPQMVPVNRALISSELGDDAGPASDGILGTLVKWRMPLGRPCTTLAYDRRD